MLRKIGGFFSKNWYKLMFGLFFLFIFSVLFIYKLGSFVKADSIFETKNYLGINTVANIFENISLAPIKILEFITFRLDLGILALRLTSVLFVGIALIVFYRLILKWQTHRIAMLSTFILASSSYVLSTGRFTFQDVVYLCVMPSLLLMGSWLRSKKHVNRLIYALPVSAILFYFPGAIWLILLTTIVFYRRLLAAWNFSDLRHRLVGISSAILLLVPMAYGLFRYPWQTKTFFGVDRIFNTGIEGVVDRLVELPKELFWHGLNQPERWVFGTPIIDVVTGVFVVLGFYAYLKSEHTLRARLLFGALVACVIVTILSTLVSALLILPILYIYAAKGMAFMLQNWFTVFPKNPAARNLGVALLLIPLFISAGYNMQRYFVAWHNSPQTTEILSKKQ